MPRERFLSLRLTRSQLELLQRVIEERAADAESEEQMIELESIDGRIYGVLFPSLIQNPGKETKDAPPSAHPMPLATLRRRPFLIVGPSD